MADPNEEPQRPDFESSPSPPPMGSPQIEPPPPSSPPPASPESEPSSQMPIAGWPVTDRGQGLLQASSGLPSQVEVRDEEAQHASVVGEGLSQLTPSAFIEIDQLVLFQEAQRVSRGGATIQCPAALSEPPNVALHRPGGLGAMMNASLGCAPAALGRGSPLECRGRTAASSGMVASSAIAGQTAGATERGVLGVLEGRVAATLEMAAPAVLATKPLTSPGTVERHIAIERKHVAALLRQRKNRQQVINEGSGQDGASTSAAAEMSAALGRTNQGMAIACSKLEALHRRLNCLRAAERRQSAGAVDAPTGAVVPETPARPQTRETGEPNGDTESGQADPEAVGREAGEETPGLAAEHQAADFAQGQQDGNFGRPAMDGAGVIEGCSQDISQDAFPGDGHGSGEDGLGSDSESDEGQPVRTLSDCAAARHWCLGQRAEAMRHKEAQEEIIRTMDTNLDILRNLEAELVLEAAQESRNVVNQANAESAGDEEIGEGSPVA